MKSSVMDLPSVPKLAKAFVGIDPSLTNTGLAHIVNGQLTTLTISPKTKGPERLNQFYQFFLSLLDPTEIQLVALEGYAFGAQGHIAGLGELGGVIRLVLYRLDIPFVVVPPTTLKKFATGKGQGEKSMVAKELFKRYGVDVEGNDQADAAGLAIYAMAYHDRTQMKLTEAQIGSLKGGELFSRQTSATAA